MSKIRGLAEVFLQTMNTKLSLLALASILSGQLCLAQDKAPVDDWKPAPSNQAGKQYPQVNSEGRNGVGYHNRQSG